MYLRDYGIAGTSAEKTATSTSVIYLIIFSLRPANSRKKIETNDRWLC